MPKLRIIVPLLALAVIGTAAFALRAGPSDATGAFVFTNSLNDTPQLLPVAANALSALLPSNPFSLTAPVAQFRDRITKKTFGMFITPDTSPVEQDRFSGYHTGVDAEFTDTGVDIPVSAIADGTVVASTWANGYGGVVVLKHSIEGIPFYALYGHLAPDSLVPAGAHVSQGQRLGILGDDHSHETDGVRKHLHFALYTGEKIDYRGYVPLETDLGLWVDPLKYF